MDAVVEALSCSRDEEDEIEAGIFEGVVVSEMGIVEEEEVDGIGCCVSVEVEDGSAAEAVDEVEAEG
jgi:hypothetical protein